MSKIVIKKRVDLEFLGDEYKEGYLVFRSISLRELDSYSDKIKSDEEKSGKLIVGALEDHFLEGKFPDEKGELFEVTKDQIKDFDLETSITAYKRLTGQEQSPKV